MLPRRKLERAKEKMLVMHPLPRVDEIAVDVDDGAKPSFAGKFFSAPAAPPGRFSLLQRRVTESAALHAPGLLYQGGQLYAGK